MARGKSHNLLMNLIKYQSPTWLSSFRTSSAETPNHSTEEDRKSDHSGEAERGSVPFINVVDYLCRHF